MWEATPSYSISTSKPPYWVLIWRKEHFVKIFSILTVLSHSVTFCFNLRFFSHFLLIGLFFCSLYLAEFAVVFSSLFSFFVSSFSYLIRILPFFLDLTASLLPGAATAVCEDVVLCALCCVQVLCAMCKCCVLCAMCFAENYVKVLCAMCRVLFTLWRTM